MIRLFGPIVRAFIVVFCDALTNEVLMEGLVILLYPLYLEEVLQTA